MSEGSWRGGAVLIVRPRPRHALGLALRGVQENCFLKKLSGVRKLTTFYPAENDHRWVTFISLKTINSEPFSGRWPRLLSV